MRTKIRILGFGIASLLLLLSPVAARAGSITESFTITLSSTGGLVIVPTSSFSMFNPALGTLNDVKSTLTGTLNYTSAEPNLMAQLLTPPGLDEVISNTQNFFTAGTIMFNISGTDSFGPDLALFIGTGTTIVRLLTNTPDARDTIDSIGALSGTITYDYTPATATNARTILAFAPWDEPTRLDALPA